MRVPGNARDIWYGSFLCEQKLTFVLLSCGAPYKVCIFLVRGKNALYMIYFTFVGSTCLCLERTPLTLFDFVRTKLTWTSQVKCEEKMTPKDFTSFTHSISWTSNFNFLDIGSDIFTGAQSTALVLFGLIFRQLFSTQTFRREIVVMAVIIILTRFVLVSNMEVSSAFFHLFLSKIALFSPKRR